MIVVVDSAPARAATGEVDAVEEFSPNSNVPVGQAVHDAWDTAGVQNGGAGGSLYTSIVGCDCPGSGLFAFF